MSKVTVVGAGNVGAACAYALAEKNVEEIALVDIIEGVAEGKALDLRQGRAALGSDSQIAGSTSYDISANSDVVVITAGAPRKPGMSRDDLVEINVKIVSAVTREVVTRSPKAILVIVSNPLDAMVYTAAQISKFPKPRVFGMAGVLDTARMRSFIAERLHIGIEDISAIVLGGHGDTMIPMPRLCTVGGVPLETLMSKADIDDVIDKTRNAGGAFLPLLKTSAWVAPGLSAAEMVDSILNNRRRVLPCSACLNGEYGQKDIWVGVPVILGRNGIEKIIEIPLQPEERAAFDKTVHHVQELIDVAKRFL
ncbi:MAG TPA: malate dehydrogenase [Phycisphaerae bacterium]|jgi:malate dehydrogenase